MNGLISDNASFQLHRALRKINFKSTEDFSNRSITLEENLGVI